jgi:hypothetical protein
MLDFDELMVKERIETALREAEQDRAIRSGRAWPSARFRVGRLVVRLGRWIGGQPTLALRDNTGRSTGHGDHC